MSNWVNKLLGINWRTTSAGLIVIIGLAGNLVVAIKTQDFDSAGNILKELIPNLMLLAVALGLLKAKDQNVTGTGTGAATLDNKGTLTNREGEVVGRQPPPPESNT